MPKQEPTNNFNGFWKFLTEASRTASKFGPTGPVAISCVALGAFVSALAYDHFIVIAFLTFDFLAFWSFIFFILFGVWQEKKIETVRLEATIADGEARKDVLRQKMAARTQRQAPSVSTGAALQIPGGVDMKIGQTTRPTRQSGARGKS